MNFQSCHRAQPVQVRLLPSLSSADQFADDLSSTVASERAKTTRVIDTSGTCALYRCHASRHSRTTRCRTVRTTRPCRHLPSAPAQWHDGALTVRGPSCESPRDSLRKINQTDPSRRQLCVSLFGQRVRRSGDVARRCACGADVLITLALNPRVTAGVCGNESPSSQPGRAEMVESVEVTDASKKLKGLTNVSENYERRQI